MQPSVVFSIRGDLWCEPQGRRPLCLKCGLVSFQLK